MSIRWRFASLLVLFFVNTTQAQQKINLESLIPPAPNAAELGKYGTVPVGPLTGIFLISVSLYTRLEVLPLVCRFR